MYQPEIQEDLIKKMYWRGQDEDKPMTRVVDEILRENLEEEESALYGPKRCVNCS